MIGAAAPPPRLDLPAGWQVHLAAAVKSTQDVAREALRAGAPGRTVFVTDHQTAGRGRQGRPWLAPPGTALLLSALFREGGTNLVQPAPLRYTLLASVALAEAVEAVAPSLRPAIKWPNDLVLNGRKLAGVLAEAAWDGEHLAVIVGLGVNVGLDRATLDALPATPGADRPRATSLLVEVGHPVDRLDLLRALVARLDAWLPRSFEEIHAAWSPRLWGRGQRLRVRGLVGSQPDGEQEVVVLGAEPDGALRVRLADGSELTTTTAEVIL